MGRGGLTAVAVWTQVPVANRLVEVNTKTGFSLTAGSYSVRASSLQTGTLLLASATSNTAAVSSVTVTRAKVLQSGFSSDDAASANWPVYYPRMILTNATTVTGNRNTGGAINTTQVYTVEELF